MLTFGEMIDQYLDLLKLDRNNSDQRRIAGDRLNAAYDEVGNASSYDWTALRRTGEIVTIPNYTDGTCNVTKDSRTVTGNGTAWTAAMQGRFFRPAGTTNWYRIVSVVSATELTLVNPVIEASAASASYTIWKRFYYFPSEVKKVLEFGSWIRDGKLTERSINILRDLNPDISVTGEPVEFVFEGESAYESSYNTGSSTLSKDSDAMTGTGTAWLSNVEPGDIVEVGSNSYRVKRVEADITIRLLNSAVSDYSAGSYTIRKQGNVGFQLWFNPNKALILPYTYRKRVYDLKNESKDRIEMPKEFVQAIIDGAVSRQYFSSNDPRYGSALQIFSARIRDLKTSSYPGTPRSRRMRPRIENNRGAYL